MNKKLFNASCFALITTAMTFAVRAKIELVFKDDFGLTLEDIGIAFGPAFYGFTLDIHIQLKNGYNNCEPEEKFMFNYFIKFHCYI